MSIFRNTFQSEIASSINARQEAMKEDNRTPEVLQYLNSRNAWIKMTSAVDVSGTANLAKSYVLSGGTLNPNGTFKSGLGSDSDNAYSTVTPAGGSNRLGIRPMPGITSVDIKSKTAYGSLREAVVSFQCWDIHQLEDLEVLYMRPGYTVLLEWGWTPYILEVNGALKVYYNFNDFYSDEFLNTQPLDRTVLFKKLYDTSTKYGGNYDAIYGYIKNYSWSAREDGGYDCKTTIISTGEIIESLKVNYVRPDLVDYGMYDSTSVGQGFLNEIFSSPGSYQTTKLKEFYEKNILAGIWAETYLRVKEPYTLQSSIPVIFQPIRFYNWSGLLTDNIDARVVPTDPTAVYINLSTFVDMMNYYIIARSDGGNKEPLVELSIKANTYESDGSILKCIAHPLQISVDPTICLIRNQTWSNILTATQATVGSSTVTAITANTQKIVDDLVKASNLTFSVLGTGAFKKEATDEDAFLTAIKAIDSTNYGLVDAEFKNHSNSANKNFTYFDGLKGLINKEFKTEGNTSDNRKIGSFLTGYDEVDDEIVNIYYLWQMREWFDKTIGLGTFKIELQDVNQNNKITDLDSVLSSLKTSMPNTGNVDNDLLTLGKLFADPNHPKFLYSAYKVSNFALPPPAVAQSAVTTIVNNTPAALDVINEINNQPFIRPYFYNDDPTTEIGVLEGIYLNVDYLYRLSINAGMESQDGKEKNEINLYTYVKNVMRGVQTSLGNVNNFELHVDPIDNKARIIDVNFAEPDKKAAAANLFELQVQKLNSIVRSYNLESRIFPNQSAIVAIGSQAQGGQLGIQNNTMIDWNTGLIDRTIPIKTFPPKTIKDPIQSQKTQPTLASSLATIILLYSSLKPNTTTGGQNNSPSNMSGQAKNSLRDIIVYFQSIVDSPSSNRNLIPTKFSFEMDGIGGLVIGHLFTINQDVLPKGYKFIGTNSTSTLAQTITGIGHKLSNSDWTTNIDTNIIILDNKTSGYKTLQIATIVQNAVNQLITGGNPPPPPGGGGGGGNPQVGGKGNVPPGAVNMYTSACVPLMLSNGKSLKNTYLRSVNTITQIVLHNTDGYNDEENTVCYLAKTLQKGKGGGTFYDGIHYAVGRGGGIAKGLGVEYRCVHANQCNDLSVGIEITSKNWVKYLNGYWLDSRGGKWAADATSGPQKFSSTALANHCTPSGWGKEIVDLKFTWCGNQYYQDYTDIQIQALEAVIQDIIKQCPNFKFNYRKGNYEDIYRNVFGMTNLSPAGNPIIGASYPNISSYPSPKTPGILVHALAPGGTHDDTFPSLKLIRLLMKFGY